MLDEFIFQIQIATVTADGPSVSAPYELTEDWSVGDIKYGGDIKHANYPLPSTGRPVIQ